MYWQTDYIRRFYRGRPGWMDGTAQFHELCSCYVTPASRVLEIGAGPSNPTSEFLSRAAGSVIGLDVDPAVKGNRFLKEAHVYDGKTFPFPESSFSVAITDYALEHVEDPPALLREIHRVLVPEGTLLFRTPNIFHYVSLFSHLLPDSISPWLRNRPADHRVYPKFFRCNSERACRRILYETGFEVLKLALIEKEPSYGMHSRLLFLPMMLYERFVNSSDFFRNLRANILCAARKR